MVKKKNFKNPKYVQLYLERESSQGSEYFFTALYTVL